METQETKDEWPHQEENDPPLDVSRERAAFERERERLVRDHLGKIALLRFDEVVGVFDTLNDALAEGHRRFGSGRMLFHKITEHEEPAWVSNVDPDHPSFKRLD